MKVKALLERNNIRPDPLKDQFFLEEDEIIEQIIGFADLNKKDVVLEIGAGVGNLTKELAKKAGRVVSFEIDKRFKLFLEDLPDNVETRFENAWDFVQLQGKFRKKKIYNKVVSNLPYSFIEPFLHNLTFLEYDKVILLVPVKLLRKIEKNPVFSSFFKAKVLLGVSKESFYPVPRTNSVVIDLVKRSDPLKTKDSGLFLRQYMYQHEGQLVKNSLVEGIIKYAGAVGDGDISKNEARRIIVDSGIKKTLLEQPPLGSEIYEEVDEKLRLEK